MGNGSRRERREVERNVVNALDRITKVLETDLAEEKKITQAAEPWSLGYQHGLTSALRLLDIECGRPQRDG